MTKKDRLTNERLNKLFESPFSLVNYAIRQARVKIAKGDVRSSNVAIEALNVLDQEGLQPELIEEEPFSVEKKDHNASERKKNLSSYTWSDVK